VYLSDASQAELKSQLELETVVEHYGGEIRDRRGDQAMSLCLLHDERNPSMSLNLTNGLWYCHTGCGGGDIVSLVQKREECSYPEALHFLADLIGYEPEAGAPVTNWVVEKSRFRKAFRTAISTFCVKNFVEAAENEYQARRAGNAVAYGRWSAKADQAERACFERATEDDKVCFWLRCLGIEPADVLDGDESLSTLDLVVRGCTDEHFATLGITRQVIANG
jgi:hypothetical protein